MKLEDYNEFYIQGSDHYLIPKDVFKELFYEMVSWRDESEKLKKQLEERTKMYQNAYKYGQRMEDVTITLKAEQKEFIKYLEDEIYNIEPKGTSINYSCEYDSEEDYINATEERSRLNTLKEILQKYKKIIGDRNEKES